MHSSARRERMGSKQELGETASMLLIHAMARNTHRLDATAGTQFKAFCTMRGRAATISVLEAGTKEFDEQDVLLCDFIGYLVNKGLSFSKKMNSKFSI